MLQAQIQQQVRTANQKDVDTTSFLGTLCLHYQALAKTPRPVSHFLLAPPVPLYRDSILTPGQTKPLTLSSCSVSKKQNKTKDPDWRNQRAYLKAV